MRVYFSGIGGVGIGPLAQIARSAGYDVVGSDREHSRTTEQLAGEGILMHIGEQNGDFLREQHADVPFDYLVYTAALPHDHAELMTARELGIMCLKRDGLLARIIDEKNLRMIAVAGTHGKTTTSGMLVWVMQQLGVPVSYSVGATLSFGPSGAFDPESQYFVYECDEYDRNMLHYTPHLTLITSVDYDHPDTYPTLESYQQAFAAFIDQSDHTLLWQRDYAALGEPDAGDMTILGDGTLLEHLHLAGQYLRSNAFLVERAVMRLLPDTSYHDLVTAISRFPGTDRRMELLSDNLYSDYGHHPAEIKATLGAARELADHVVLVYQPHQNVRQHHIGPDYTPDVFADADSIYWLPTYLSREDDSLDILTPEQLSSQLDPHKVQYAALDDVLWRQIKAHIEAGDLVIGMGAGDIDAWLREQVKGGDLQ